MENNNGKGNGNWKQATIGAFLFILTVLNGLGLWILSDVKYDIRQNRKEFYEKIDRVVSLYRDEQKILLTQMDRLCGKVSEMSESLKEHDTLLRFNFPQRQQYFREKK